MVCIIFGRKFSFLEEKAQYKESNLFDMYFVRHCFPNILESKEWLLTKLMGDRSGSWWKKKYYKLYHLLFPEVKGPRPTTGHENFTVLWQMSDTPNCRLVSLYEINVILTTKKRKKFKEIKGNHL